MHAQPSQPPTPSTCDVAPWALTGVWWGHPAGPAPSCTQTQKATPGCSHPGRRDEDKGVTGAEGPSNCPSASGPCSPQSPPAWRRRGHWPAPAAAVSGGRSTLAWPASAPGTRAGCDGGLATGHHKSSKSAQALTSGSPIAESNPAAISTSSGSNCRQAGGEGVKGRPMRETLPLDLFHPCRPPPAVTSKARGSSTCRKAAR